MVRLDNLVQHLVGKLNPVAGTYLESPDAARRELAGVHISELIDPTPYLDGSELLLTTGLGLIEGHDASGAPRVKADARVAEYVARLARRGIAGLAFSLGPNIFTLPTALREACIEHGLPLFSVPAATPFLSISRTYWDLVAAAGAKDLTNALSAQAGLTRAATSPNARGEIVKLLAQRLGGWVVLLPTDTSDPHVWPETAGVDTVALRRDLGRLNMAGPHSAATFMQGGDEVVTYPIAVGRQVTGFLAIGLKRRLSSAERHVVLSACGLLALDSRQRVTTSGRTDDLRAAIVQLVLGGHDVAARDLAAQLGLPPLPGHVRVLLVGGTTEPTDALKALLGQATGGADWVGTPWYLRRRGVHYFLEDAAAPALGVDAEWGGALWGVCSRPVSLAEVPSAVEAGYARRRPGRLLGPRQQATSTARTIAQQVAALLGQPGQEVHLETVRSYLRHRGRWEEVSKDLDLHRNTVRNRMALIRETLTEIETEYELAAGAALDDPDIAAHLWLILSNASSVTI
ncbi:PucR family transcriptional regulator ligand-binding domain-containing protein [Micrococcales bacterium 31B]|nr:PucR family transcriptional regulator ligand-binding domain-containing protein [Micrococcales bacterium 31B]